MEKFPTPIESQEKEKSPEELKIDEARRAYAGAYTENRFRGFKEKELAKFEKDIEPARKFIEVGDSNRLKTLKEEECDKFFDATKTSPEERERYFKEGDEARDRRDNFIKELIGHGIEEETANAVYEVELKKAEYEAAKVEAGKKMAESGISQAEIFQKLVLNERELLNQQKVESWPPKEKGIFRKGMDWYMKSGTATRLLISTGIVTAAVAGVGGFGAAAAATFAGYRFVRGFGSVIMGKLAGKGVDWIMSKGIIAQKEASLEKLKSGFDLSKLKETEKELEKIFEETAKKEQRKLLIKGAVSVMAGAGAAIGMGMLEHVYAAGGVKVAPESIKPKAGMPPETLEKPVASATETPQKPSEAIFPEAPVKTQLPTEAQQPIEAKVEIPTEEAAYQSETIPQSEAPVEKIIDYQGGKSIWQEAGKQWETRFKEFADLGGGDSKAAEALETYNIDRIKDTIADAIKSGDKDLIEKYGLAGISDPDTLTIDQLKGIKWSDVFEDTLKDEGLTEDLPSEQVESIVKNNTALREFFNEYPNAPRTSGNYENILRGKGDTGVVPETIPASETPKPEPEAAVETKPVLGEKIADLDKQIADVEDKYAKARLKLLEADVNRYTSDLPRDEIDAEINKYYEESAGLEKQIEELKASKSEILQQQPIIENKVQVEKILEIKFLNPEKVNLLDDLVYKDTNFAGFKVDKLVELVKTDKITSEDFARYCANKLGAGRVSDEILNNLKNNFRAIIEGSASERLKAQKAMEVILERLRK